MLRTVVVLAAAVLVSACGSEGEPTEDAAESVDIDVRLTTTSGAVAANHDDEYCMWLDPAYVLRDGGGDVIATGDARSQVDGDATVGGEPAEIGEVTWSADTDYRCSMRFGISADPADFYELEVSTQEPRLGDREFTESVTFSREDAESVEVEFSG